ncbi:MAG: dihydrolipoamide acetyltransferase family protein [Phycisphaerales bacterium]|jgi:pyruvate dehydrogenase E2 component (dihydrolipoamide acetyltransferase)|nr:dihydrolipoamide acetyltransferase family protein [Phycisphaerales bacterium]
MAGKVSSDPNIFLLPDIGEGLTEAELVRWLVKEGDTVVENQSIAEVETDKALTEIPTPRDGVIATLHYANGDVMKVGEPMVSFVGGGSSASTKPAPARTAKIAAADAALDHAAIDEPAERTEDAGTVVGAVGSELAGMTAAPGKALATPAVRRLARDLGVNIDEVTGSGIGGRVMEKDVRAHAQGGGPRTASARTPAAPIAAPSRGAQVSIPAPSAPAAPAPAQQASIPAGSDSARVPFRGVRRTIANRLRQSVDRAVHFNVMDEADVTELDNLRRQLASASGEKVSFLPFVASAVCRALTREFGALNAIVDDEREEIVQHRAVHLGIATDTESGLMVPVVRDCDRLGVLEVQRHINHVAKSARDRSAPREMLAGSTFTISNVGSYAGRFATPILNYPEVGILAVGRTREGMVVQNGWFRVGKLLPLSLACDHRVVDGATAALCLARIVELLQEPQELLTPAR